RVPRGRSTYTRAGVPSAAATSRTVARTGAESSRTAVAPPGAGVTSKRRSSAASPCAAARARLAPSGAVHHHHHPFRTGSEDREAGGGNQGAPGSQLARLLPEVRPGTLRRPLHAHLRSARPVW